MDASLPREIAYLILELTFDECYDTNIRRGYFTKYRGRRVILVLNEACHYTRMLLRSFLVDRFYQSHTYAKFREALRPYQTRVVFSYPPIRGENLMEPAIYLPLFDDRELQWWSPFLYCIPPAQSNQWFFIIHKPAVSNPCVLEAWSSGTNIPIPTTPCQE